MTRPIGFYSKGRGRHRKVIPIMKTRHRYHHTRTLTADTRSSKEARRLDMILKTQRSVNNEAVNQLSPLEQKLKLAEDRHADLVTAKGTRIAVDDHAGPTLDTDGFSFKDFNLEFEDKILTETITATQEYIYNPPDRDSDKFTRSVLGKEHTEIKYWSPKPPSTLYVHRIFTDDPKSAGHGNTGRRGEGGGFKIFWWPYSATRTNPRDDDVAMMEVQPAATAAHEYHHVLGGDIEFDEFGAFVATRVHLQNGISNKPTRYFLDTHFTRAFMGNPNDKYTRRSKYLIRHFHNKYPTQTEAILRETVRARNEDEFKQLIEKAKA